MGPTDGATAAGRHGLQGHPVQFPDSHSISTSIPIEFPRIDVFLVDVELRLMNGERLVQQLVPHRPAAKVLLISQGSVPRPMVPGASWLPTPCSREDLAMRVHQALETKT